MNEYETLRKSMQEKWLERFANIGAYFKHDGNVNRPHVVLGTGIHSDHFFNSQVFVSDPMHLDIACTDLYRLVKAFYKDSCNTHWVIGFSSDSIAIASSFARTMTLSGGSHYPHRAGYCEREHHTLGGGMIINSSLFPKVSKPIVIGNVVISDGLAFSSLLSAFSGKVPGERNIFGLGFVACLWSYLRDTKTRGVEIVSLVKSPGDLWSNGSCPLCKQGSIALKPEIPGNWDKLNQAY